MKVLALMACLLVVSAAFAQYVPLTYEEALKYVQETSPEELAREIMKLDAIEHSVPVVTLPGVAIGLLKNGQAIMSFMGPMTIDVAWGALKYEVSVTPAVSSVLDGLDPMRGFPLGSLVGACAVGLTWFLSGFL